VQNPFPHIIRRNTFWISSERCIFWEDSNTLIVSDLHLGKSGHFRKAGIAVPQGIYKDDLQRLMAQLYFFKADRLIIVGDLTHSTANKELDLFKRWRKDFSSLRVELIKGNHDILADSWYQDTEITVYAEDHSIGDFCFRHEPGHKPPVLSCGNDAYTFSGHVHPGIVMRGRGKQSLRLPCFYFTPEYAILPAFSRFTGTYLVDPADGEIVYGIAENQLVQIA
jgi:DNA ligase-associated metallophosphoesterase